MLRVPLFTAEALLRNYGKSAAIRGWLMGKVLVDLIATEIIGMHAIFLEISRLE
jgi:hypothetical protein